MIVGMKSTIRASFVALSMLAALLASATVAGAQGTPLCDGQPATIVGTEGNDRIFGTDGPDVIVGLGGNDVIRGLGGNDVICGGNGRDRLFGGRGADVLLGGKKNDAIKGDGGPDRLFGNQGNDRLIGGGGGDRLDGGSGVRDALTGKGGTDTCLDRQSTTRLFTCEVIDVPRPAPNLTAGLPLGTFQDGIQTNEVTPPGVWRRAEFYYGMRGLNLVQLRESCGVARVYAAGFQSDDVAEYLMMFGEDATRTANRLVLRGIADGPGPVEMRIYVDGVLRSVATFEGGHETLDEAEVFIPGVPYGVHAIAVEFANDLFDDARDVDRNMWLDGLKVVGPGGPDVAPTVQIDASRTSGSVPLTIDLEAIADSSDGDSLTYDWDFGDGMTRSQSGSVVCHTYYAPGSYDLAVTVTDGRGQTARRTVPITVTASPTQSAVAADEFIVGAIGEPRLDNVQRDRFVFDAGDFANLQALRDAGFDVIHPAGTNSDPAADSEENYARQRYLIEYLEELGDLRLLVRDLDAFGAGDDALLPADAPAAVLSDFGPHQNVHDGRDEWQTRFLTPSERDVILGYALGGGLSAVPFGPQATQAEEWVELIDQADGEKLPWLTLDGNSELVAAAGCNASDTACARAALSDYFSPYVQMAKLTAVTDVDMAQFAPQPTCGAGSLDDHYWLAKEVLAELVRDENAGRETAKRTWTVVRANRSAPDGLASTTRADDYRHRVNSALLYGATGVFWSTYQSAGEGGPSLFENENIYATVQGINAELAVLGPTLIDLDWLTTVHSDATNNEFRSMVPDGASERDCIGRESDLTVPSAETPLVTGFSAAVGEEADWAAGVFRAGASADHLMIFNKARLPTDPASSTVTVELDGSYTVERLNTTSGLWEVVSADATEIVVTLDRSAAALLRLEPSGPLEIGPPAGQQLDVVGIDRDEVLSFRLAPDPTAPIVATSPPETPSQLSPPPTVVASGTGQFFGDQLWLQVTVDGVSGWGDSAFLGILGSSENVFLELQADMASLQAPTIEELAAAVAATRAGGVEPVVAINDFFAVDATSSEAWIDVIGIGDDVVAGERIRLLLDNIEDATPEVVAYEITDAISTAICGRGITAADACL